MWSVADQTGNHKFGHILHHDGIPGLSISFSSLGKSVESGHFEFVNISGTDYAIHERLMYKLNCHLINYNCKREPNTLSQKRNGY